MIDTISDNNNRFFRQLLFIAALIGIGILIWMQLGNLINCFLGAITLYIVFRPLLFYFTEKKKWKPWLAAVLLLLITIVILSAAGFLAVEVVVTEMGSLDVDVLVDELEGLTDKINQFLGFSLISKNLIVESKGVLGNMITNLVNGTYNITVNFFMMLVVLCFMFASGRKMENVILKYFPFKGECQALIKKEVKDMIFGNAIGIPIIMIVQGIVSGFGYWLVGIEKFLFFGFLTALTGLIPLVGTAIVWVSLSIYLLAIGHIWQGLVLLGYGMLLISNADNACRLVLMKKVANTHPLIVIFGVILGIPLFGFWGIIFGPLLISGFFLLIKIYYVEYYQEDSCIEAEKILEEQKKAQNEIK
jgi:predicted PurR-regulated permease PerM